LPFILAGNYHISDEARASMPEEEFFKNLMVPLDRFGDILTVSMPVLTTAETMLSLESKHKIEIFPYVGLISENRKVLSDEFDNFKAWSKQWAAERERHAIEAAKNAQRHEQSRSDGGGDGDGGWANIFDEADQAVRSSNQKP
jgi:hypothetical protein